MTDRELLEKAAKAAGITLWHEDVFTNGLTQKVNENGILRWNPLKDDGDALRLAAILRLTVGDDDQSVRSMAFAYARHRPDIPHSYEPSQHDPAAAYRRAIVRAAAAIWKKPE